MKDFPIFTTDYGVASLILKEIPYKEVAYILIRDVQPDGLKPLVEECVSFCRMAGAERVLVSGHPELSCWEEYCSVLEMRSTAWVDPSLLRSLFPVTKETVTRWREIYNKRMRSVDNTSTLESRDEAKILEAPGAYFIHDNGKLLGIGWLEDTKLLAVASAIPGAGASVMHTLMSLVEGAPMELEVASTNERAIRLYESLGFLKTREISHWYRVGGSGAK